MKKIFIISLVTLLSGCVSDYDLFIVNNKVMDLETKIKDINDRISNISKDINVVKKQRVVRLPIGSPIEMRDRSPIGSVYVADDEQFLFNKALSEYKSGNIKLSINDFEHFNSTYPNSINRNKALYYIGNASYAIKDYYRSQKVLEELVYKTPEKYLDSKYLSLLGAVYQETGQDDKIDVLNKFIEKLNANSSNIDSNKTDFSKKESDYSESESLPKVMRPTNIPEFKK